MVVASASKLLCCHAATDCAPVARSCLALSDLTAAMYGYNEYETGGGFQTQAVNAPVFIIPIWLAKAVNTSLQTEKKKSKRSNSCRQTDTCQM